MLRHRGAMLDLPLTLYSAPPAAQAPMGDCGPWGGAREELLGATLLGTVTAGRRPKSECGPRAAAEAARHKMTKPHRLRTLLDAGRERASGATGRSKCRSGASTSRLHWSWTWKESRASGGLEERYAGDIGTDHAGPGPAE
jgi:hypothetical protein